MGGDLPVAAERLTFKMFPGERRREPAIFLFFHIWSWEVVVYVGCEYSGIFKKNSSSHLTAMCPLSVRLWCSCNLFPWRSRPSRLWLLLRTSLEVGRGRGIERPLHIFWFCLFFVCLPSCRVIFGVLLRVVSHDLTLGSAFKRTKSLRALTAIAFLAIIDSQVIGDGLMVRLYVYMYIRLCGNWGFSLSPLISHFVWRPLEVVTRLFWIAVGCAMLIRGQLLSCISENIPIIIRCYPTAK